MFSIRTLLRAIAGILVVALFFTGASASSAQENPEKAPGTPGSSAVYVNSIRFTGNNAVPHEELRQIIVTAEPSSFLGLGLFGKSKKPFNPDDFQRDLGIIKKLYTYKGYFFADIRSSMQYRDNGHKTDILISITENEPARIDSLSWSGLEAIDEQLKGRYVASSILKTGENFSVEKLIGERDRTMTFFREEGYTFFHEDSIRIKVDTVGANAGILYKIKLPEKLVYGPVNAVVHNPVRNDTSSGKTRFLADNIPGIIFGKQKIRPELITSAVAFREGQLTRESLEQETLQNFGKTNLFSSIIVRPDSVRQGRLFTTVHLEPAPKHQIEPKLLVDNRYGSLFFGASLAYENRNLFGGAEQLKVATEFGTQTSYSNNLLDNLQEEDYDKFIPYELSLKTSLVMPVLKKPDNVFSAYLEYSESTLPILLSSRNGLLRGTYSSKLGPSSRLSFDFFEFEWVQKDSLRGFRKLFKTDLAENIGIDPANDAAVDAGIDSLLETRVNQTFRLRYNYTNLSTARPGKNIWNLDLLLEESGSLAWLIDEFIDTGSHSGFTDSDPQIFGTAYSQYVKAETKLGFTRNLSPERQLAGRLHLGWMMPYGKAETTPEERRFFAGGANSMRGWLFNTLGPGSSASEAAANFGADIKMELGLEYRWKFFKLFGQPSGITFFTDIGNIWDSSGPYGLSLDSLLSDFAWDFGVGLRVGSPIGPFRFDFAWKIHDPAEQDAWRILDWSPLDYTFNFGIGEAF
ncbi:sorting and assembly machinery component 50 [Chlorobium sp.]|uniref:sorting and assembly machinery component 50 n=1 Tax=Chlorobium sp. TaxID=1095 RepID=UPI0025C7375A|nr:sorting and assembly machinery component 50 [Chlorobium sp.]